MGKTEEQSEKQNSSFSGTEDQFVNCKMSRRYKPYGDAGISRRTCYDDINKLCQKLSIDKITEKMCKSLGTR